MVCPRGEAAGWESKNPGAADLRKIIEVDRTAEVLAVEGELHDSVVGSTRKNGLKNIGPRLAGRNLDGKAVPDLASLPEELRVSAPAGAGEVLHILSTQGSPRDLGRGDELFAFQGIGNRARGLIDGRRLARCNRRFDLLDRLRLRGLPGGFVHRFRAVDQRVRAFHAAHQDVWEIVAIQILDDDLPSDSRFAVGLHGDPVDAVLVPDELEPVDHRPVVPAG